MLCIGKPAIFSGDGMAVKGQYQTDTGGWRLRWFRRGESTVLWTGHYDACRRLMADCGDETDVNALKLLISRAFTLETTELAPVPGEESIQSL